jgi:hypothetical protein
VPTPLSQTLPPTRGRVFCFISCRAVRGSGSPPGWNRSICHARYRCGPERGNIGIHPPSFPDSENNFH